MFFKLSTSSIVSIALATVVTVVTVMTVSSCGPKIDTGRNGDPSQWPTNSKGPKSLPGSKNDGSPDPKHPGGGGSGPLGVDGKGGPGSSNGDGGSPPIAGQSCFETQAASLPAGMDAICDGPLKSQPAFKQIYPILCQQRQLIGSLNHKECGWNGTTNALGNFIHFYYVQPDKNQDYEEVSSTIMSTPVTLEKFMAPLRLVFENYDEFKRQGFQWISGTRQNENLSHTTWEQGIQYRFRADKESYEIGYQALTTLYKLGPNFYIHLNYGNKDFERISEFSQVAIYQQLPDYTSLVMRMEHRKVASTGLYDRAKKSSLELIVEMLQKANKNATK